METLELTKEEFEQLQGFTAKEDILAFFSKKGLSLTDDDLDSVSGGFGDDLKRNSQGKVVYVGLDATAIANEKLNRPYKDENEILAEYPDIGTLRSVPYGVRIVVK